MKIEQLADGRSVVRLVDYADLLTVRALPDYRFVDRDVVEVDTLALEQVGLAGAEAAKPMLPLPGHLFDYQAWVVERAFQRERFAAFMLTGLGKTLVQLEWARQVAKYTAGRVLIVAPLNVVSQTIGEAHRFYGGQPVLDCTDRPTLDAWLGEPDNDGLGITNYEKLDGAYERLPVEGVVLDESSMLRSLGGSRKWSVVRAFAGVRFKLACSATPAPNDRTEYAQHAVWLDQVRATKEYLTAYFRNDGKGNWDFKTHAYDAWVANLASWAVFMHDPARWRFAALPEMPELVELNPSVGLTDAQRQRARLWESGEQASLLGATPGGVTSRVKMQQIANGFELVDGTVERFDAEKPGAVVDLVAGHGDEQVIVWVHFDAEGDRLAEQIAGRGIDVEHLSGATPIRRRADVVEAFRRGDGPRVLILKPAMFGQGLNLQACTVQIFSSVHDSFERYFQCIRRSYRFGQTRPVRVYVPLTDLDEAINSNVMAKQATFNEDARRLEDAVVARLRPLDTSEALIVDTTPKIEVERTGTDRWTLVFGDALAHMDTMPEASVDHAIFSPPFPALFAYSKELGDVANVRGTATDTSEHRLVWQWAAEKLLRVVKPGRIVAIHCKEIIQHANTHGYRWCYDYPSELRAGMEAAGFHYHRRITIAKNPQSEATRNKETSLLHVTVKRNALNSFPQAGEYLMVFAAPGEAEVPVPCNLGFEEWTEWANTIWPDHAHYTWHGIRETDVLNTAVAKGHPDERHCCPLQLGLIERTVRLWSNPDELVFSPFAGIGSEGVVALEWGRRFYGIELKESYYRTAARNLAEAEEESATRMSLFDEGAA